MGTLAPPHPRENYVSIPIQCPMLSETNYTIWAVKLKAIFNLHGLWEVIEPTDPAPANPDVKKNNAAIAYLYQSMPEEMVLQVANLATAREIWASIRTRFVGVDRVKKARLATLKNEFERLKMPEGDSIDEFAAKITAIQSKANDLGEPYEEKAIGRLKTFEERTSLKAKQAIPKDDQLLLTYSEWQSRKRDQDSKKKKWSTKSGQKGKDSSNVNSKDKKVSDRPRRDKSTIKCFKCEQMGPYASECSGVKIMNQEANVTKTQEESVGQGETGPALFMAQVVQTENRRELVF
ncbi:uncharacterized protein LOC143637709 [Bidens hawaiensis]|uniref:uncharacterized protein LOC143637709 n=1 Tax=Bidens hawaiensis TaxID=980011 RepID=UPI00404ADA36